MAPWNVGNYSVTKLKNGNINVDDRPLICFHFSNLVFDSMARRWDCSFTGSVFLLSGTLRELYINYILEIRNDRIASYTVKNNRFKLVLLKMIKKICRQYILEKDVVSKI